MKVPQPRVVHEDKSVVALLSTGLDIGEAVESFITFVTNVAFENILSDDFNGKETEHKQRYEPNNRQI